MAHEFAYAARASRLGQGWHEKMQSRYVTEERLADLIAVSWGFEDHLRRLRRERDRTVNPLLEARAPQIMRRMLNATRDRQMAIGQTWDAKMEPKGE